MNLKHLTDETLHSETHRVNQEQSKLLIQLLHHLRENERRRLFSKYKYPSLFAYVIGELKYSEDEANRRISAMRLLREIPEIESKISSGALSMTNLVAARSLFSKEAKAGRKYSQKEKREVLIKLENQSVRNAQKIVAALNPEMKTAEGLDFDSIEDDSLRSKLLQIKGYFAHSKPHFTLNEILHMLCDKQIAAQNKSPAAPRVSSQAEIRRQVWKRDQGKCTNCGSNHAIEIDHRIPRALGGLDTIENLRLLCRSCNQRAAIECFGIGKISSYLGSRPT